MKIAKCKLTAGGMIGQLSVEQRKKHSQEYLQKLIDNGEKIIETYEENGYLVIKMEDNERI